MTSGISGLNSYAQYGSAYARAAVAQNSLAGVLAAQSDDPLGSQSNSATQLTLSAAARAQLANGPPPRISAPSSATPARRSTALYKAAGVTAPIDSSGKATIDLASLDQRALFAIASNAGGKFSDDEQNLAGAERLSRFNAALSPAAQTAKLTGDYSTVYTAAASYLDGASSEEKATATWQTERAAIDKGLAATQADPSKAPAGISNDPVASYLAQYPNGSSTTTQSFASVAKAVRAKLDAQASAATAAGKELVYDAGRKTGQLADLSQIDNRSLSAIALNQDQLFSAEESRAAKQTLDSRNRASILAALKQSQSSGDPTKLSLGILNAYSAMSSEERTAANWTPALRDHAVQSYKSTSSLLSMLRG